MIKYLLYLCLIDISIFAIEINQFIPLDKVLFNKKINILSKEERKNYQFSSFAFRWNDHDNRTNKWRPQGITKITFNNKKFLAISWYARKKFNFKNQGVKISFVNLSNKKIPKYRHILLVDKKYKTFKNMHAGGLTYAHNKIYVPDTRNNKKIIRVFSIKNIKIVPNKLKKIFFNYKYILQEENNYHVPVKPSFISYDFHQNKLLIGSFHKNLITDNNYSHSLSRKNALSWFFPTNNINKNTKICSPYFYEMQGAATMQSPFPSNSQNILFISSSFGKKNNSRLYIVDFNFKKCNKQNNGINNYKVLTYPPGLEDLHISKDSKTLWSLTEFKSNTKNKNNRIVFAINIDNMLKSISK